MFKFAGVLSIRSFGILALQCALPRCATAAATTTPGKAALVSAGFVRGLANKSSNLEVSQQMLEKIRQIDELQQRAKGLNLKARDLNEKFRTTGAPTSFQARQLTELLEDADRFEDSLNHTKQHVSPESRKTLLQMRFREKINSICVLSETDDSQLQHKLRLLMLKNGVRQASVHHAFNSSAYIETHMTDRRNLLGKTVESFLKDDALSAGARAYNIQDGRSGRIVFICDAFHMSEVTQALADKGYTVIDTRVHFIPKDTVKVDPINMAAYLRFVELVVGLPGVEGIYDNVAHNAANYAGRERSRS